MRSEVSALIAAASAGYANPTLTEPCTCEERPTCKCDPHESFMWFTFHLAKMLELTHESGFTNFETWCYDNERFQRLMVAYGRCISAPQRRKPAVVTLLAIADKLGRLGVAVNSYRESKGTFEAGLHFGPEALEEQYQGVERTLRLVGSVLDEIFGPGGGLAGALSIEIIELGAVRGDKNDDPDHTPAAKGVKPWTPL